MPSFEEWRNGYLAEPLDELEERRLQDAYEAGQSAATFAANSKLGDEGNEGMKAQRRKVAVDYILHECDSFGPCLKARELDAIIKEAQG